ncbi:MAG TPA: glycosyl hydrolase 115 family protein, partial [Chitinophagaceae bacterium]|nr:glycosyl hydrolase 115 family protein [Chitinophagaceae bacterium]
MKRWLLIVLSALSAVKCLPQNMLSDKREGFDLLSASIVIDPNDDSLIHIAARLFQKDIEMVSGYTPSIVTTALTKKIILIGNINNSRLIKELIKDRKLNVSKLKDQWEGYQIQVIKKPFKDIEEALVIAGSDRRGTAYGVFELSKQIGVSPWYWWADVPVKKKNEIYIDKNISLSDAPKVKYRGIFINDEAPALSNWSKEKFGGFNHQFYEKVFELILRLKANYLWPAMWGNAFYDDDLSNKQ